MTHEPPSLPATPEHITTLIELFLCRKPSASALASLASRPLLDSLRFMLTGEEFFTLCSKAMAGDARLIAQLHHPLDAEKITWVKQLLPAPLITTLPAENTSRIMLFERIFTTDMQEYLTINALEEARHTRFTALMQQKDAGALTTAQIAILHENAVQAAKERLKKPNEAFIYSAEDAPAISVTHGLQHPEQQRNYGTHDLIETLWHACLKGEAEACIQQLTQLYRNEDDAALIALHQRLTRPKKVPALTPLLVLHIGIYAARAYMRRFMFASALQVLQWLKAQKSVWSAGVAEEAEHLTFYKLHATCLTRTGDIQGAMRVHQHALAQFPNAYELHYLYGMMRAVDSPQNARFHVIMAANASKKLPRQLHISLIEYFASTQDELYCYALLQQLTQQHPQHRETHLAMQNAYMREGEEAMRRATLNQCFIAQGLLPPYPALLETKAAKAARKKQTHLFDIAPNTSIIATHHPLVTVIMTSYNAEATIESSIASVLAQTCPHLELYVVDDGSSDKTRSIITRMAKKDARIKPIFNEVNVGTYVAKNKAMAQCAGTFITFHDSDDWMHPQRVQLHLLAMQQDPQAAFSCSEWFRMDAEGYAVAQKHGGYVYRNPASLFLTREAQQRLGFFDSVRTGADTEYYHRAKMLFGARASLMINATLTIGLDHDASLTKAGAGRIDEYRVSPVRLEYWEAFGAWQLTCEQQGAHRPLEPHITRDARAFPAPEAIVVG